MTLVTANDPISTTSGGLGMMSSRSWVTRSGISSNLSLMRSWKVTPTSLTPPRCCMLSLGPSTFFYRGGRDVLPGLSTSVTSPLATKTVTLCSSPAGWAEVHLGSALPLPACRPHEDIFTGLDRGDRPLVESAMADFMEQSEADPRS